MTTPAQQAVWPGFDVVSPDENDRRWCQWPVLPTEGQWLVVEQFRGYARIEGYVDRIEYRQTGGPGDSPKIEVFLRRSKWSE